jgi:hypothetical protein
MLDNSKASRIVYHPSTLARLLAAIILNYQHYTISFGRHLDPAEDYSNKPLKSTSNRST